jgi:hypothetical protein
MSEDDQKPLPGWPEVEPFRSRIPEQRYPYDPAPLFPDRDVRIEHYHAAPVAPARRGPDPWTVLGWVAVGAVATAALLAVAVAAVAIAAASLAVAASLAILYLLFRKTQS